MVLVRLESSANVANLQSVAPRHKRRPVISRLQQMAPVSSLSHLHTPGIHASESPGTSTRLAKPRYPSCRGLSGKATKHTWGILAPFVSVLFGLCGIVSPAANKDTADVCGRGESCGRVTVLGTVRVLVC